MLSSCCFLLSLVSLVWLLFVECSTCRRRARRKQHGNSQQGESRIQTSVTQPLATTYHSTPTAPPAESVLSTSPPRTTNRALYYQATLHQPIGQNYDHRSLSASRRHNYGATAVAEPIP